MQFFMPRFTRAEHVRRHNKICGKMQERLERQKAKAEAIAMAEAVTGDVTSSTQSTDIVESPRDDA